jgi:arylsulfatase A-like enzyme
MPTATPRRPNLVFILCDDHAAHAISAYGSRINRTPHIDRIAARGFRFDHCYCTNSICTPSRASILTGTHNHTNGVTTLRTPLPNTQPTFPGLLRQAGYQTAIYGKWHLGEGPAHQPHPDHFDDWAIVPGQGLYHNPKFIFPGRDGSPSSTRTVPGYATDLITDFALDFLDRRDPDRPFCLLVHHKAPHRPWEPDDKHAGLYADEHIPEPPTLHDDYANRSPYAAAAHMRVGLDQNSHDLKCAINKDLPERELRSWAYQRYIKDYLRVVASIDDNTGRLLDHLQQSGQLDNTLVIYTSDQGFFLGDHGWYDKRFMYEDSLKMPFLLSLPARFPVSQKPVSPIVTNVDFAPTLLALCEVPVPAHMQGRDFSPLLRGETPPDWQTSMYYRYWMNGSTHNVAAHYGIRTHRHKLIYFYNDGLNQFGSDGGLDGRVQTDAHTLHGMPPAWELFDLDRDPCELVNVYSNPDYAEVVATLKAELRAWQTRIGDTPVAELG